MRLWSASASVLLLCAACASPPRPPPAKPVPPRVASPRAIHIGLAPHAIHLANGLTAIFVADPHADLATVYVSVRAGSLDDPPDHPGLAHVAGHLSYALQPMHRTRWDELDRLATAISLAPDAGATAMTAQFEPDHLAAVLRIEADRLVSHCDDRSASWLGWQRGQVADEMRAATNWRLNRELAHAVFPDGDPRARMYDATSDTLAAIARDDACGYLDRYYVPANTTIVVGGPFEAPDVEREIRAAFAALPAGEPNARPAKLPPTALAAADLTVGADVNEPTLAVSYALPADPGERALTIFAIERLAAKVEAMLVATDQGVATIWYPSHLATADAALAKITGALKSGVDDAKDFEAARTRRITELLGNLDGAVARLAAAVDGEDLDAPFAALDRLTLAELDRFAAAHLALEGARVLRLVPDAGRPAFRIATLALPTHGLIGPSSFDASDWPAFAVPHTSVRERAHRFQLANGMMVMLVPTSSIPLVEVALAFDAGNAAEPFDRPGLAMFSLAALDQQAERLHATTRWAVGTHTSGADLDSSGIVMRGTARDLDLVLGQLDGLVRGAPLVADDLTKPREKLAKLAASPARTLWTQSAVLRATRYGANHPYGRAHAPTPAEVAAIGVPDIAAFVTAHLQPDRATLIITGGFDPAAALPIVHRAFDGWHGTGVPRSKEPAQFTAATYARTEARPVVNVWLGFAGGRLDDHYAARLILANMLGTITAKGSAHYVQRDLAGGFEYAVNFEPAKAPLEIAGVLGGIADLVHGAPRYLAAFESARSRIARGMWGSTQSASGWEMQLQFAASLGRDLGWVRSLAARAARVTYADVAALARTELQLDRATVVVTGPHDAVAATCSALTRTPTWLDDN